ncbi:hypothetical protein GCM10010383_06210 [Streptomyces lomondensis]|uniref:Uncharacterized protein n=1 Tax=Streptomyces lomondensis TaxID=68229 RepID=A0ABQ2WWI4_9ACTN|nr:hypothetical protein GCM10010383_06210 [Streptomyces lomondensis]
MNAESHDHWCGYRLREGTVDLPVQLLSRTCAALTCREDGAAAGPYAISRPAGGVVSWAMRSTRGSPKDVLLTGIGRGYRRVTSI